MSKWLSVRTRAALVALGVALTPALLFAADTKAPEIPKGTGEGQKKIDALASAYGLIDYARDLAKRDGDRQKEEAAVALLTAAQMINTLNPTPLAEKDKKLAEELEKQGYKSAAEDPKALIAEARKISTAKHVAVLADKVEEMPRGRDPGSFVGIFTMTPKGSYAMMIPFKGGEEAVVGATVQGAGEVRLVISNQQTGWSKTTQGSAVRLCWYQQERAELFLKRDNLSEFPIRVYLYTN